MTGQGSIVNVTATKAPGVGNRGDQLIVAARLRALRKRLGVSQEQFAKASKGCLSRTEVNKAEKGNTLARTDKWLNGVAYAADIEMKQASLYLTGVITIDALGIQPAPDDELGGTTSFAEKSRHPATRMGVDTAKRLSSHPAPHGGKTRPRSASNPVGRASRGPGPSR